MQALVWIAIGLVAGSLARVVVGRRSNGLVVDLVLGLLGAVLGAWLFRVLGIVSPQDTAHQIVIALIGAVGVLGIARAVGPVTREAQRVARLFGAGEPGAAMDLEEQIRRLGRLERQVLERVLRRGPVTRDTNAVFDAQMTFGQRVADRVAAFGGSWTFIGLFLLMMLIWMLVNSELRARFDPYPFILLNLVLSCLAALQAPVIMMSQNRQAARDRIEARNDYEVNLRSEMDIQRLHTKLDEHREQDWTALVELQNRQIALLEEVAQKLNAAGA
jgi:uncharacterized membrane protein/uncharacterized membrane protein YeaQ/YmgE (transglycosylase-associated protein family)